MSENILNDEKTIKTFQRMLNVFIKEGNFHEIYLLGQRLKRILEKSNSRILISKNYLKKYKNIILTAKFMCLHKLDDEELVELIDKKFNFIFKIKLFDLKERWEHFLLVNKRFLQDRDEFKEKLRKRLLESQTKITKKDLEINKEKFKPTIANWLKDFRNEFTEKGFFNNLNLNNYISNSKNINGLSKREVKKVKTLINFYALLKFPSTTVQGLEENIFIETEKGKLGTLVNGRIEKIPQAVIDIFNEVQKKTGGELYDPNKKTTEDIKKVFTPEEDDSKNILEDKKEEKPVEKLLKSYKSFEIDLKGIEPIIKGLEKYQNNPDGLFEKFNKDLQQENRRDDLLSVLVFICQNKLLDKFLRENKELLIEFKKYLSFKLSDDVVQSIIKKSASPETVSLYLQFLLFKKIKLSPKNAGLFGMHLANIFKKIGQEKYFPMVYGDLNLEQFVWREVIEENGLVKFK